MELLRGGLADRFEYHRQVLTGLTLGRPHVGLPDGENAK